MRYYVRRHKRSDVQGPFTVEELIAAVEAGSLNPDSLASSDLGEGQKRLRRFRRCDWSPMSEIPEMRDSLPVLGTTGMRGTEMVHMPLGMMVICGVLILASLGYVFASTLQMAGVLQVSISLPMRLFGALNLGLWVGAVFCIITRRTWGWHFCMAVIAVTVLANLVTMVLPVSTVAASWRHSMFSALGALVAGAYLYRHRVYFSVPDRSS